MKISRNLIEELRMPTDLVLDLLGQRAIAHDQHFLTRAQPMSTLERSQHASSHQDESHDQQYPQQREGSPRHWPSQPKLDGRNYHQQAGDGHEYVRRDGCDACAPAETVQP